MDKIIYFNFKQSMCFIINLFRRNRNKVYPDKIEESNIKCNLKIDRINTLSNL